MRISTGIDGLDYILSGGFLPGRSYLVHGEPGTGKTTLGLHFVSAEDGGLLITLGQSSEQIRADANSLGLNLDNVRILDLAASPEIFSQVKTYDIFAVAEVEREPWSQQIAKVIEDSNPRRIFVDGFGHFRYLAEDAFHYRRLVQSFFRFATNRDTTLVVSSEGHECARDVDGVIELEFTYEVRSIRVTKFRGSDFHPGPHSMVISSAGLQVPVSAA